MDFGIPWYAIGKDLFGFFKKFRRGEFQKTNYEIIKRETDYVIYSDGTIILHMVYKIRMKQDGDFTIEKYYECVNEDTKLMIDKIYDNFYETSSKKNLNRFKKNLLVIELLQSVNRRESVFRPEIVSQHRNEKTNKDRITYAIRYTNLKRSDFFEFSISLTIPKEFNVKNNRLAIKEDRILISYDYNKYIFRTKIDKQHRLAKKFSPICTLQGERVEPKSCENIYYKCFEWEFKKPPKGEIIIKFDD